MQYLVISRNDTMSSIAKIVGNQNMDAILYENGLERMPRIGEQWYEKCEDLIRNTPNEVNASRKSALLNSLTGSDEAFEKACLMDEDEWKVFSAFQSFPDTLRVPESIKLPSSSKVIGENKSEYESLGISNGSGSGSGSGSSKAVKIIQSTDPVSPITYRAVMNGLKNSPTIDPGVFDTVNTSPPVGIEPSRTGGSSSSSNPIAFNLPWGKIQMYSSLLDDIMDFPAYPEQVETGRTATYTTMPDIIYQYEPWIVYQSSGPREQTLTFHMHRDMWSGNHLDGQANKLIRFCEANTFPRYSGSAVLAPRVRLYIDGSLFISGTLISTNTTWSGPLGQDNWYLEFELTLSIQEVAETALNIDVVKDLGLIGS